MDVVPQSNWSTRVVAARDTAEFRSRQAVIRAQHLLADRASVSAGVARLAKHRDPVEDESSPIFVLGAGWRTGSTMLQRMINARPGTLVWGEPYGEAAIIQRLAESLAFLDPVNGRFHGRPLAATAPMPSAAEWTANLTPPIGQLIPAYRALLDELFAEPARARGCSTWGVKEVVLGGDAIHLLTLLYPRARFLMLVRDPLTQWRSYRPKTRRPWFYRWPDKPVGSPRSFGRMWSELAGDFMVADCTSSQARLVRYEDLTDPVELERLGSFLGFDRPLTSEIAQVGSSRDRAFYTAQVPRWEQELIRARTAKIAKELGYSSSRKVNVA